MSLKVLFKILGIFRGILNFIGTDKIYNWAKPLIENEVRKMIDLKDDITEAELEQIVITTAELFLKFALGLPLDYQPKEK